MYQLKKKVLRKSEDEFIESLCDSLNISKTIAKILIDKGYTNIESAKAYLEPSFQQLYNPYLFLGMDKAVAKIKQCIALKEKIIVYGDYDVDGIVSCATLFLELSRLGANVKMSIPDRHTDGYGLHKSSIEKFVKDGAKLIITVDCGITAVDEVKYAYENGVEVIITDHHEASGDIPCCEAVINPKIKGQTYPFRDLCGAGVAVKLIEALSGFEEGRKYYDLIALATIADLVPLHGENRVIAAAGLSYINDNPRVGLKALMSYAMKDNETVKSYHVGYKIAPMINAAGRIGSPQDGVLLLLSQNEENALELADKLHQYNERRKQIEISIVNQCIQYIEEKQLQNNRLIMVSGENWESGVVGIAASRIVEIYHKPVIIITKDSDSTSYHGSCRSIEGINIYDVLFESRNFLSKFGGHEMAAGLTIEESMLDSFYVSLLKNLDAYPDSVFEPVKYYDSIVKLEQVTEQLVLELERLEPCGNGNSKVQLLSQNASFKNIKMLGTNQEHFACTIYDEGKNLSGIAFGKERPDEYTEYDIIITPNISFYNGTKRLQCIINFLQYSEKTLQRIEISKNTTYGARIVDEDIEVLGLPESKNKQFKNAGIFTVKNLLNYFPKKYLDFRFPKVVKDTEDREVCCLIGKVIKIKVSGRNAFISAVDQNGDYFTAMFFSQYYVSSRFCTQKIYAFCGTISKYNGGTSIAPAYYSDDIASVTIMKPEYKKIKGMSTEYLEEALMKALNWNKNTDYLNFDIVDEFQIMTEYDSTLKLHKPKNDIDVREAKRRKVFDSLFKFNFKMKDSSDVGDKTSPYKMPRYSIWAEITKSLPYSLTKDQASSLEDMRQLLEKGERLNCLVQGDVGTGKTIVAFYLMALAMENGFQSTIIAPTEVLARQHYDGVCELLEPFGVNVGYLAGKMKAKEKREILKGIEDGTIHMVVGTHAVIQDSVNFNNLGLIVIDEQHRFGVKQREKLMNVENKPHLITMSATPIPRTLSMAMFGDNIQVFNIKTKPAGRKEIKTIKMLSDKAVNDFMLNEIRKGRQCYIVCPLIEESTSDKLSSVKSVNEEAASLVEYFKEYPEVKISNISGKMKQDDISAEIEKFAKLETNILISTTIIEVGVNVPNSTVMVIKNSERFGLAQAHQLRGRVGRGDHQSYCILQTDRNDLKADVLCNTSDGFEIAKQDLMMRGTGDFIGTQQSGANKDVMLMIAEPDLYKKISELNNKIFNDSSLYNQYKYIIEE